MKWRKKIMAMFFVIWVIAASGETVFLEAANGSYASNPYPADGAMIRGDIVGGNISTELVFVPGATAVEHTGYFSDDYSKVESRAQDANLGPPPYGYISDYEYTFWVGNPQVPPADESLVRGTTYYWCVDETDALGTTYPGEIWEFTVWDYKACCPNPPDGAVVLGPDVLLSWKPGYGVEEHDVYISTDFNSVELVVYDHFNPPPEYLGTVTEPNILVTGLAENTTYYWRVDEIVGRGPPDWIPHEYYKGDVWSFKTAGLIAHWKFDEGSGTIAYDSAGNNDGTVYGADWRKGAVDGALDFDGVDDYVEFASVAALQGDNLTALAWVRVDESAGLWNPVITQHDLNGNGYSFYIDNNRPSFLVVDGSIFAKVISLETIDADKWYHVAGTNDGSNLKLYVDGQLKDSETSTGFTGINYNAYIGFEPASMLYYKGLIDDVRIYDRALSALEIEELYNSVPPVGQTFHVDGVNGDNTNDGLTRETAFATIQRGINVAEDFDTVLVWPDVYNEEIAFWGDAITVRSAADAAIVETDYGYAFSFFSAEGHDTLLSNFVIRNSQYGIYLINGSSPALRNLTIVNNDFGISAFNGADPDISSCIFWNNYYGDLFRDPVPLQARYSCIEEGGEGEGNISIEPGFVDANGGDYHLLSERGRYWPAHDVWVLDDVTSPCVDGGDPAVDPSNERMPNGGRINMGAYGNTAYASMSEWPLKHDSNFDGVVDMRDLAELALEWLETIPIIPGPYVPDLPPAPAPVIITIGAVSSSSIMMTATEAFDESGVEYYFEALSAGGHDSGWIGVRTYTDVNLIPDTTYCYRVKARDKSINQNETIWSPQVCAVTVVLPDTLAPLPDPMQWDPVVDANGYDGRPIEVFLAPFGFNDYGATMRAIDADDQAPTGVAPSEVEYYFQCQDDGGFDSGWRTVAAYPNEDDRRTYTVRIGGSGHAYRFRVKARDASDNLNETDWSDWYPAVYRDPP